jgi:hypothetical protein
MATRSGGWSRSGGFGSRTARIRSGCAHRRRLPRREMRTARACSRRLRGGLRQRSSSNRRRRARRRDRSKPSLIYSHSTLIRPQSMSSTIISAPTPFVIGGRRALTPLCLLFLFDSSFSGSGLPFAHARSRPPTRIFPYFHLKRLISLSSYSHYQPPALSIPIVLAAEMSAFDEKLGRLDFNANFIADTVSTSYPEICTYR